MTLALCATLGLSGVGVVQAVNNNGDNTTTVTTASQEKPAKAAEEGEECSKNETVYVMAGADGTVNKVIVSDWLQNVQGADQISDISQLTGIENVNGEETFETSADGSTLWKAQGNDIYYQGSIEKELPVEMKVTYFLDGKEISPSEIAGRTGKVTIRFDYENLQKETAQVGEDEETIYVPFAALTGMYLDNGIFKNVEVTNGKVINDGNRTIVVGVALPGMQENLGIDKEKLEIPDYVEITADADGFEMGMTVTVVTNEVFNQFDAEKLTASFDPNEALGQLTDGMSQLVDGSSQLYDGLNTLSEKSKTLSDGVNKLVDGAVKLKDGVSSLDAGAAKLQSGAGDLKNGLNTLAANNGSLNDGAKQVFNSLLSTATSQLNGAGISVPQLTIENYATVLTGVINSLDSDAVYNQALQQVTAAVEAQRGSIETLVTASVRAQVAEQVIPAATGMSKSDYENAVAAGMVDEATQAAVNGAIDAQLKTENVQGIISQNVEAQVQKAISDNMASEAVQSKLSQAFAGAQTIISLKTSLDSYNSFYTGLLTYTDGVSKAAGGAASLESGAAELKKGTAQLLTGANTLYDGLAQVKENMPALLDGVNRLTDGALKLSDGIVKLDEEGIQKIVELVDGDLETMVNRVKATCEISKEYKSFSGISDDMDGTVKFIYRTEEIKAK